MTMPSGALYALIDRMRDLQREQRLLSWFRPFTRRSLAEIDGELAQIGRAMFPPIKPSPRAQAMHDAIIAQRRAQ